MQGTMIRDVFMMRLPEKARVVFIRAAKAPGPGVDVLKPTCVVCRMPARTGAVILLLTSGLPLSSCFWRPSVSRCARAARTGVRTTTTTTPAVLDLRRGPPRTTTALWGGPPIAPKELKAMECLGRLLIATFMGGAIGFERRCGGMAVLLAGPIIPPTSNVLQYVSARLHRKSERPAGIRTMALVSLGASIFTMVRHTHPACGA
jgi:hypothetical protein